MKMFDADAALECVPLVLVAWLSIVLTMLETFLGVDRKPTVLPKIQEYGHLL